MKKSIKKYTRSKVFKEVLLAAADFEEAHRKAVPKMAKAILEELRAIRKFLGKNVAFLLLLLLLASPAFAASIVLTGGTIDIDGGLPTGIILSGPELFFTGNIWQDLGGPGFEPGRQNSTGLFGTLVGTLIFQGQPYPLPQPCEQTSGLNCGRLDSRTSFFFPANTLSVTVPFALTGSFRRGDNDGTHVPGLSLPEVVSFTGSGLLTAQPLNTLHYEITAVPEPATWLLLLSGLGVFLFTRRGLCGT